MERLVIEIFDCYDNFIGYLSKKADYKQFLITKEIEEAKVFDNESEADLWNCKLKTPPCTLTYIESIVV